MCVCQKTKTDTHTPLFIGVIVLLFVIVIVYRLAGAYILIRGVGHLVQTVENI